MDVVLNTDYDSAGTKVWITDLIPYLLDRGHDITRNDWDNYSAYDVAVFMAPDSAVRRAKRENPDIVAAVMDPKLGHDIRDARRADVLAVSSIEQKDRFLPYNDNVFIYPPFPQFDYEVRSNPDSSGPVVLGYHGNIYHARHFEPRIRRALERLADELEIELVAVYNIERFGRWKRGVPANVPVEHVQWSPTAYSEHLADADIGIVNNFIPLNDTFAKMLSQRPSLEYLLSHDNPISNTLGLVVDRKYRYDANDYLLRFKYTTNPGRIYPFVRHKVPVVCDFSPSNAQFIRHGESGYLTRTEEGWYHYLKRLITDPDRRIQFGEALHEDANGRFDIDDYAARFVSELERLHNR